MTENLGLILENKSKKTMYEEKGIPFKTFGNEILIAVKEILSEGEDGCEWRYVTNDDLERSGKSFEEVYAEAYKADGKRGFTMQGVYDYVASSSKMSSEKTKKYKKLSEEGENVWIVTNASGVHGAGVLLHGEFMEEIYKKIEEDRLKRAGAAALLECGCAEKARMLTIFPVSSHRILCTGINISPSLEKSLKGMLDGGSNEKDPVLMRKPIIWNYNGGK